METNCKHLSCEERTLIQLSLEQGCSLRVIARSLQRAILGQTGWVSCRSRYPSGALLRNRCAIATGQRWTAALRGTRCRVGPAVALQLATDRTRCPLQAARNYPQRAALLKVQLDQRAFFTAQVFVVRFHGNTLSPDKCCTSDLRLSYFNLVQKVSLLYLNKISMVGIIFVQLLSGFVYVAVSWMCAPAAIAARILTGT